MAKNRRVHRQLRKIGVPSSVYPVYPDVLITARHALHKFPDKRIVTIGLRHGAYHFKEFIKPERYNAFDLFLFTSQKEVEEAREIGITNGVSGGFPKIDDLFDAHAVAKAREMKRRLFDTDLPTIFFAATWSGSGLSALHKWYNVLGDFTDEFNVLVSVHPQERLKYIRAVQRVPKVRFIAEPYTAPYLLMADVMVTDTSSIIAEFNVLEKPIITFAVSPRGRFSVEMDNILDKISIRINHIAELRMAIRRSLESPLERIDAQRYFNNIFFEKPAGNHGALTADIIRKFIDNHTKSTD